MTETTMQPDPQVEWGPSCPVCGNLPDQPAAHWPRCGNTSFRRRVLVPFTEPVTAPAPTLPGLTADHLPFLARLLTVAEQAGVTVTYYCFNYDWAVMTSPELDDAAGTAFLRALDVGDVGKPEQGSVRTIRAGRQFRGGVCLYVQPIPTDDTTEESK